MKIWIFQSGEPIHSDDDGSRPMRAINLTNVLIARGNNVVLWTSAFYHQKRMHRFKAYKKINISKNLEIRLIPSPGYKKTISISRFYDHCLFAWNLHKQLKRVKEKPDVAFVGYPPIETAYVMSSWLKKRKIPFLLDVKDQWPVIFEDIFPPVLKPLFRVLLTPYYFFSKKIMLNASGIIAQSKSFLNWALSFSDKNNDAENNLIVPLTTTNELNFSKNDLSESNEWWSRKGIEKKEVFRVIFVGTFSRVYDFDAIFEAAKLLSSKYTECEFIICGDGDRNEELHFKAQEADNIKIIEWIDQSKMISLANISHVSIAPYKNLEDFKISIPNKIIDSLMLGLPILSPLQGELALLLKTNEAGLTYSENNNLYDCIRFLIENKNLYKKMVLNAKNLYKKDFEFEKLYGDLAAHLENLKKI